MFIFLPGPWLVGILGMALNIQSIGLSGVASRGGAAWPDRMREVRLVAQDLAVVAHLILSRSHNETSIPHDPCVIYFAIATYNRKRILNQALETSASVMLNI